MRVAAVTPTQLRAFAAVVRLGSVKKAAVDLEVSEAAVSLNIGQLRKELGDRLFVRRASGIAFTPGGLRLASRAAEMLGLQDRTILEVSQAGAGRRLLRVAASSLFAEHAAPGLLDLFASRADDLDVELSVHGPRQFHRLLHTRTVDVAIGPRPDQPDDTVTCTAFLNYELLVVAGAEDPAGSQPKVGELRSRTWLLGPSASTEGGAVRQILRRINVPEDNQRIFQSDAAALEEAKRNRGIALAVAFVVTPDLAKGYLKRLAVPVGSAKGTWHVLTLADGSAPPVAAELARFVTTPRATQAMLRGSGVTAGRFRPSIHVTLWS
jgi:DNA-binding transcriptional LysR family regulator